jgi:Glycosyl hydrolase family 26
VNTSRAACVCEAASDHYPAPADSPEKDSTICPDRDRLLLLGSRLADKQQVKPSRLARRSLLSIPLGALVLIALAVASTPAAGGAIRLGAHISADGIQGAPAESGVLDEYSSLVGRAPEIVLNYSNPTEPLLTPVEIANLEARHETPMITWQLFQTGWSGPGMSLEAIAAGQYDSYFRSAAQLARTLGFEIMIRPGHEMNGDWYPWSGHPQAYVAAWRHIVTIFREEEADNVKWVWAPNVEYDSYPFTAYFPGDAWIDYAALDGYNWGTAGIGTNRWESLYEVFAASYARITALSSKPVILSEVASGETGGNKAEWIRKGFLHTIPEKFPRVAAVVWFDYDKEEDWRVNSSPAALQAFRQVVASPLYGGRQQRGALGRRIAHRR